MNKFSNVDAIETGSAAGLNDSHRTLHTELLGDLLVVATNQGLEWAALAARAAAYATRARGDGTRRVYRSAWHGYETWCFKLGCEPLAGDADLLAMYATSARMTVFRPVRCAWTLPPSAPLICSPVFHSTCVTGGWPW